MSARCAFSALVSVVFTSLLQPSVANATMIVSTFDVGNTYDCCTGHTISGASSIVGFFAAAADEFTSPGNYSVDQLDVALQNGTGTNSAIVSLWRESGGFPGSQLGSWAVSGQPAFGSTNNQITTISGITGVDLIAGDAYFLAIGPGSSDTSDAWNWNTIGVTGLRLFSPDGVHWNQVPGSTFAAFDVLGKSNSVPEPSTLTLLGAGLAALAAFRRCRRRAKA